MSIGDAFVFRRPCCPNERQSSGRRRAGTAASRGTAAGISGCCLARWAAKALLTGILLTWAGASETIAQEQTRPPNVVIILADDLGYGDLGCYGSAIIRTPRLDRMAAEGMRFTDFYAQPVCGPSRAALMTACYPVRIATRENDVGIFPLLHRNEVTLAEVLHEAGYATYAIGKWDLAGHSQTDYHRELLPTDQGFDGFYGTPSSNDALAHLLRGKAVIERNADLTTLTARYTDEAIAFVKSNKQRPFFLYLAHSMPHTRLGASEPFRGKSAAGLYGDVVEELDWNVGRLLDALAAEGIDDSTYVIFTSDNGPWYLDRHLRAPDDARLRLPNGNLRYPFNQRDGRGSHGGSAGPLRGAKTSVWEGGFRVPCIVRAPGRVPAGVTSSEWVTTLEFLPTLARLAGARIPSDRIIDGLDVADVWQGVPGAKSPRECFYYYQRKRLEAVREGRWKLHLPRPEDELWAIYLKPEDCGPVVEPLLFDLETDIGESRDVAARHPEIVARLLELAEKGRKDLGDDDRMGEGARFFDPQPRRPDLLRRAGASEGVK